MRNECSCWLRRFRTQLAKCKGSLRQRVLWWVLHCLFQVLHIIDDTTDIIYNVAAEAAGGIVSSRSELLSKRKKSVNFYYRPPTKLRKGNVFSRVCLAFCLSTGRGVTMWPLPLPMMHWTSLYRAPLSPEAHTVGKEAVRNLLKCFLVINFFGGLGRGCWNYNPVHSSLWDHLFGKYFVRVKEVDAQCIMTLMSIVFLVGWTRWSTKELNLTARF